MIQVFRGRSDQLLSHSAALAERDNHSFWFYCPPGRFRAWNGVRVLLHQLATRLGSERVDRVVSAHRPAVSFAWQHLVAEMSDDELAKRRALGCRVESHLSHNWFLQRALFDAWAEFLIELLPAKDCRLLVPVMNHLDQPSLFVLKSLYRLSLDRAPDLIAGYDSEAVSPTFDRNGIYWHYEPLNIQKIAYGFQLSAGCDLVDLSSTDEPTSPEKLGSVLPAGVLDSLGEDLESRAWAVLELSGDRLGPEDIDLVTAAIQTIFESFGYRLALGLGLELLRHQPQLTPTQAALVHSIIGLSTHNRQFHSRGNPALDDFLESHFREALEHETQPVRRCALLYRMAVTLGRRKQKFEEALEFAGAAISEASELSLIEGVYQEAWARNIRAYLLMRLRRLDEAVIDAEASFSLIERFSPESKAPETPEERVWSRDYLLSQGVLISNLSSLATATGSQEQYEKWNRKGTELAIEDPSFDRFRVLDWVNLYRRNSHLKQALPWALKGAEACRREQEALWEYHYLLQASDLVYRLGDADRAYQMCEQMGVLRARLGNPIGIQEVELLSVTAGVRSGRHESARQILEKRLQEVELLDARSEIASHLGILAASMGDAADADASMNQAIEWAVSSGQRDSLLRVAAAAGRSCRLLGRHDDARAAYRQALAIAEAEAPSPPVAADLLAVLLGLQEAGSVDLEQSLRALRLLPKALQTDETWWQLGRLLEVVTDTARTAPARLESQELVEPLAKLVTAARQRQDTAEGLETLMAELPAAVTIALQDSELESTDLS